MSSSPLVSIPGLVFAGDIEAEQVRLRAAADAVNAAVQACGTAKIDAPTIVSWTDFYTGLCQITSKQVHTIPWPWLWDSTTDVVSSGNFADTIITYERELIAWQDKLAPKCPGVTPRFDLHNDPARINPSGATPTSSIETIVKWGTVAAVAIAGAYIVSKVAPPILGLLPDRRSGGAGSAKGKANPLPRRRGAARSKHYRSTRKVTLVAKAIHTRFDMADGRRVSARGVMMHDETGRSWPKRSCLIGPMKKGGRAIADNALAPAARDWLGPGYRARVGTVSLPPKALRRWRFVGYVSRGDREDGQILYTRRGKRAPGPFYHPFNAPEGLFGGSSHGRVRLYRLGSFYRLELPRGAVFNWRGFVRP